MLVVACCVLLLVDSLMSVDCRVVVVCLVLLCGIVCCLRLVVVD